MSLYEGAQRGARRGVLGLPVGLYSPRFSCLVVGEPVSGRRARKGLRKLHPPSRAATPRGVARERRLRTETIPPPVNAVSPGQGRGRRGAGVRRPTRRVKGRIGAGSLLQGARVARIAECRLEQKVGYDRRTDHISNSARASIGSPSFRARIPYLHSIEYRLNVERVLNLLNLTRSEPT